MKRVYLAAVLIVAAGAGIGFLLRPATAQSQTSAESTEKPAIEHERYYANGGVLHNLLPPPLLAAAANRPDCFYMHVAYANSLSPGSHAGNPATLYKQGADAGCWMGN